MMLALLFYRNTKYAFQINLCTNAPLMWEDTVFKFHYKNTWGKPQQTMKILCVLDYSDISDAYCVWTACLG